MHRVDQRRTTRRDEPGGERDAGEQHDRHREGRGVVFGFMVDDWLTGRVVGRARWKVLALAALFAAIVTGMMLPFALTAMGR